MPVFHYPRVPMSLDPNSPLHGLKVRRVVRPRFINDRPTKPALPGIPRNGKGATVFPTFPSDVPPVGPRHDTSRRGICAS